MRTKGETCASTRDLPRRGLFFDMKIACLVGATAVFALGAGVCRAAGPTYRMPTYTLGTYDRETPANSTLVPTTATLAFAGTSTTTS